MATPHIDASQGDFAKTVLMPGDPLRSKFIAENFLSDAVLVNNLRGVQGYTGFYKGQKVSVMASGMGMPSIGIYSYELFKFFGVENIIRVGSAGGISENVKLRDIILAVGASTDSAYGNNFDLPGTFAPICDTALLEAAVNSAKALDISCTCGNVLSTDVFYSDSDTTEKWRKMGILAVEMEAAALYMNAARLNKRALAILTVSDHLLTGEALSGRARETSFTEMMRLSLECAIALPH